MMYAYSLYHVYDADTLHICCRAFPVFVRLRGFLQYKTSHTCDTCVGTYFLRTRSTQIKLSSLCTVSWYATRTNYVTRAYNVTSTMYYPPARVCITGAFPNRLNTMYVFYHIVLTTYNPGKWGSFIVSCTSNKCNAGIIVLSMTALLHVPCGEWLHT